MATLSSLHSQLSQAGLYLTLLWAAAILFGAGDVRRFGRVYKTIYLAMMIVVGLGGLAGLAITLAGPWKAMLFPWIGLVLLGLHNMLGAKSRRALAAYRTGPALILALAQVAALAVALVLMIGKWV